MANQLVNLRYGRYRSSSSDPDTGMVAAGQLRASVFDPLTQNVWFTALGAWMGKSGGSNATVRLAVYESTSSMVPASRAGYSNSLTVSIAMTSAADGAAYSASIAVSDNGPSNAAIMGYSGKRYGVGILATGAGILHGMKQAAEITADNESFYNRSGLSQPPPNPFGAYTSSNEGHLSAYAEGWINEAPLTPNNLSPTGSINETAPVFTGDFRDRNGAYGASSGTGIDTGDQLNQYQIQVRAVGTTALLWNSTYTATSAEQTADAYSRAYGGSVLTRGVAYEQRSRTSDEFGAFGDWSSWTAFTPANLGFVTLDSTPTGVIQSNQPDFSGRWNHQAAAQMTRVHVRLLNSAGAVIKTGSDYDIVNVNSSASPGTLFTIPWASAGLNTLAWGTNYTYQIRGYDGSNWSNWSASRAFKTNAAPTIPGFYAPSNGSVTSSYPKVRAGWTDADDTTASGLTGTFRITRPNATEVDVTPTYNATTGQWEFQLTNTEVTVDGAYSIRAAGYDGTLYSGERLTLADAIALSPVRTFTYGTGPVVTITNPVDASVITGASLAVSWTVTGQVKYTVNVFDAATDALVYASNGGNWTVSAIGAHTIPPGYLRNGGSYYLTVTVENATPLQGTSDPVTFSAAFTPPAAPENVQLTPVNITTDPWATALRLTFDQPSADPDTFVATVIERRASSGPDADPKIMARLNQSETSYTDYTPASDVEYTFSVRVITNVNGLDDLESVAVEATGSVSLGGIVLSHTQSPDALRTILMWRLAGDPLGIARTRKRPEAVFTPLSGGAPRTNQSTARWWETTIDGLFVNDHWATARERVAELEALDKAGGTLCARDQFGRKEFVVIADGGLTIKPRVPDYANVALALREEAYAEGEVA